MFDLGLHQDASYLSETTLSSIDIEARQMAFWGCFNLDRCSMCSACNLSQLTNSKALELVLGATGIYKAERHIDSATNARLANLGPSVDGCLGRST